MGLLPAVYSFLQIAERRSDETIRESEREIGKDSDFQTVRILV